EGRVSPAFFFARSLPDRRGFSGRQAGPRYPRPMSRTHAFPYRSRRAILSGLLLGLLAACASGGPGRVAGPVPAPVPAPEPPPPPPRIGLALGGGAAKGFAHIGVIKMLEANGIKADVIAGTSAGSLVGALYAGGMDPFTLQERAMALDESSLRDVRLFSGGLVQGQALQDYVNRELGGRPIERL